MSANGSESMGTMDTQDAAEWYLRAGLAVIPVPAGEKNPNRPGWQNERHAVGDVPELWNNGQGVGVLWGEPSDGRVDVDLDWREARAAAPYILPATRSFGRPGAPESHRIYRVTGEIPKTKRFKIGGDGDDRSVVEVLSTGTQSLIPPSLHDSGERREWYREQPATEMDAETLMEGVSDVATAALIARKWPGRGSRKDYVMAAAGYVGRHLPRERAERAMKAATAISGDEEEGSRLRDVWDTLDKLEAGSAVTGGPTLDDIAPGVADQLRRWHGWGNMRRAERRTLDDPSFNLTDLGNAERLIARHGDDLRYAYPLNRWLVWDRKRWKPDTTGEVERRARETVRAIYSEAESAGDKDERRAIARHATASESRSRIDAMIALSRSMVPVAPDDLDANPWLLNVLNGTIDLQTDEIREHRREDLITKIAPVEYDPEATAPTFEAFLARILPSEALRRFVQRAIGYAAAGVVSEEILVILYGVGANGKSTLGNAVMDALGEYAMQAAPDLLMAKKGSHPTELADLFGARFVASVEVDEGRRLAEGLVKQLTGRDPIKARRMREDFWQFAPTHTVFLATNHRPEVKGTDHAIWRRLKLVPFKVTIPEAVQDKGLPEKLRAERPGILAWIVRGCREWQRGGLGEPEEVRAATSSYRADMDVLAAFIEDRCVVHENTKVASARLYNAYRDWCQQGGEAEISQTKFSLRLKERGYTKEKDGLVFWHGIGLRDDRPDPGPGGGGNTDDTASDPPNVEGSVPDPPNGESGIGKGNDPDLAVESGGSGPNNDINSFTPPREALIQKKPPNPPNPPKQPAPSTVGGPRLTPEQAERVKRLMDQGMSAKWARDEVLSKAWVEQ